MNDSPHPLTSEIARLNDRQREAVLADDPRIFVIAGAGAGKTRVLALRIARLLIEGVPAQYILAVTFTRKAAEEMKVRVQKLLDEHRVYRDLPDIRTLHSWGANLLRRYADRIGRTAEFSIYDEVDYEDIVRGCAEDLGLKGAQSSRLPTLLKDARVRKAVDDKLRVGNALTFDQIESLTQHLIVTDPEVQALWTQHYRHVLVDEFQDTNLIQLQSLHGLAPANLFAVGDVKQAIYSWRGVDIDEVEAQTASWTHIQLPVNYRSAVEIVAVANSCFLGDRYEPMESAGTSGAPETVLFATAPGDSEPNLIATIIQNQIRTGIPPGEIAVLARTWRTLAAVRDVLVHHGIPHHYCGAETDLWSTADGRAVARAAMLTRNPADDNLAAMLAEWGATTSKRFGDLRQLRAIAMRTRRRLIDVLGEADEQWGLTQRWIDVFRDGRSMPATDTVVRHLGVLDAYTAAGLTSRAHVVREAQARVAELGIEAFCDWWTERTITERVQKAHDDNLVQLTTVHAAKGLEWRTVIGVDATAGTFPKWGANDAQQAEDNRVFYVMVTRPKHQLILTRSQDREWSPYIQRAHHLIDGAAVVLY